MTERFHHLARDLRPHDAQMRAIIVPRGDQTPAYIHAPLALVSISFTLIQKLLHTGPTPEYQIGQKDTKKRVAFVTMCAL